MNQHIAARLGIGTKTVETHMSRIFKKLGEILGQKSLMRSAAAGAGRAGRWRPGPGGAAGSRRPRGRHKRLAREGVSESRPRTPPSPPPIDVAGQDVVDDAGGNDLGG
ncbi:helix-turn-helix transcriptional regulator [Streptomyces sp. NPDC001027]|uniref:helix-turn-helix domain-containing protein n=1 Tax=Streptomyces sp. NPDC001027 TaxID=3154771 RepID=UPI003327BB69